MQNYGTLNVDLLKNWARDITKIILSEGTQENKNESLFKIAGEMNYVAIELTPPPELTQLYTQFLNLTVGRGYNPAFFNDVTASIREYLGTHEMAPDDWSHYVDSFDAWDKTEEAQKIKQLILKACRVKNEEDDKECFREILRLNGFDASKLGTIVFDMREFMNVPEGEARKWQDFIDNFEAWNKTMSAQLRRSKRSKKAAT
jgi:hypothetical protein